MIPDWTTREKIPLVARRGDPRCLPPTRYLFAALVLIVPACASMPMTVARIGPPLPPKPQSFIPEVLPRTPDRPHLALGILEVVTDEPGRAVLAQLLEGARELGADALVYGGRVASSTLPQRHKDRVVNTVFGDIDTGMLSSPSPRYTGTAIAWSSAPGEAGRLATAAATAVPARTKDTDASKPNAEVGLRLGASTGPGGFAPGPEIYWGVDLHAGMRASPQFGAYLRLGSGAGSSDIPGPCFGGCGTSGRLSSVFLALGVNAELESGGFFVAAGPQVGGWRTESLSNVLAAGPAPGLDLKLGFGRGISGNRWKTTLTLDVSMLWATQVVSAPISFGVQGAWGPPALISAVSYAPTLQIGFELR